MHSYSGPPMHVVSGVDKHPMGESDDGALPVAFDRRLKLEFHGSRITSDAGLLACRELDDALGLTDSAGTALSDGRHGRNVRHLLSDLLRQSVFGRLAGYEDVTGQGEFYRRRVAGTFGQQKCDNCLGSPAHWCVIPEREPPPVYRRSAARLGCIGGGEGSLRRICSQPRDDCNQVLPGSTDAVAARDHLLRLPCLGPWRGP